MAENLKKRPVKGILKSSTSFEKQDQAHKQAAAAACRQKETKWDEMNIMATLHPADKDYGHMKIEEPKTPYNWANDEEHAESMDVSDGKGINAMVLAEKISSEANTLPKVCQEPKSDEEEDEPEAPEDKVKRKHFESKRKMHYNEFQAVKLARKLMEEDEEEDGEGGDDDEEEEERDDEAAASSSTANTRESDCEALQDESEPKPESSGTDDKI